MNFSNPAWLGLMLPLGAAILVFWMLRVKRQPAVVSSLFLWQSLLQEKKADAPWRKLRRSLLLFLQLLAAFLLVAALANPFLFGKELSGRTILLVIDASAPMNATDVAPSRLAAAKAAAAQFVQQDMDSSDSAAVIVAAGQPRILTGFTGDKARLLQAIERAAPTNTVVDMSGAMELARGLAGLHDNTCFQVYSDGALTPVDTQTLQRMDFGAAQVTQTVVGTKTADNVAITALSARRAPQTGQVELFAQVENLGRKTHPGATLSLLQNGRLIAARALTLPGGEQDETFDGALLQKGGVVTARLDGVQDDLALDNAASVVLPSPGRQRVLLVSNGNLYLERGLASAPAVHLDEIRPQGFAALGKRVSDYSLIVLDGDAPVSALPPGNYLTFHTDGTQSALVTSGGAQPKPQFVDQNGLDPRMRFVDLSGLLLRQSPQTRCAAWAEPLAEASSGPLIAAGEHGGRRMVSVAFDLAQSNWPLRVSFPIFLANVTDWAATPPAQTPPANADPLNRTASMLTVTLQPALNHPGVTTAKDAPRARHRKHLLWPAVAALALFALACEWFVYHRRV